MIFFIFLRSFSPLSHSLWKHPWKRVIDVSPMCERLETCPFLAQFRACFIPHGLVVPCQQDGTCKENPSDIVRKHGAWKDGQQNNYNISKYNLKVVVLCIYESVVHLLANRVNTHSTTVHVDLQRLTRSVFQSHIIHWKKLLSEITYNYYFHLFLCKNNGEAYIKIFIKRKLFGIIVFKIESNN